MENKRKTSNPAPPTGGLKGASSLPPTGGAGEGPGEGPAEVWKVIPDFPRYEVSNMGRVRSSCCKNGRKVRFILKAIQRGDGYLYVDIFNHDPETGKVKVKQVAVHRLVAQAFIGECPPGKVCDHKSGDRWDNRLENLRYASLSENRRSTHTERFKGGFRIEVFRDGVFIEEVSSRKRLFEITGNKSKFKNSYGGRSLNALFVNGRIWRYKNFVAILYLPIDSPPALPCREGVK